MKVTPVHEAEDFREVVRGLLRSRWLSQRRAAEEIGVGYKWLRRLCHHGLQRPDRRTKADLERLAAFFGLGLDDLWLPQAVPEPSPRRDRTLIKWTGSKWRQAGEIVSRFPSEIATYYEPFLGGGAVFYDLLRSDISVKRFRCSDTCAPLIALWKLVQTEPQKVLCRYEELWEDHRQRGVVVFYEVRESFNDTQDPCNFYYLLRTCRNGVVRFDRKGRFSGLHNPDRTGIPPHEVHALLTDWHERLLHRDVEFTVRDYRSVRTRRRDVLYIDPPYPVPGNRTYSGEIAMEELFAWLGGQRGASYLSLPGFVGDDDRRLAVPTHLYDEQVQIDAGTAPLRPSGAPRVTNTLYINRPAECGPGAVGRLRGHSGLAV